MVCLYLHYLHGHKYLQIRKKYIKEQQLPVLLFPYHRHCNLGMLNRQLNYNKIITDTVKIIGFDWRKTVGSTLQTNFVLKKCLI